MLTRIDFTIGGKGYSLARTQFAFVVEYLDCSVASFGVNFVQILSIIIVKSLYLKLTLCLPIHKKIQIIQNQLPQIIKQKSPAFINIIFIYTISHTYIQIQQKKISYQQQKKKKKKEMNNRKYKQISVYSKILKRKKATGEIEEVPRSQIFGNENINNMEQEDQYQVEELAEGSQFQDDYEDIYEEEEAWVSQSQGDQEENQNGEMITEEETQNKKKVKTNNNQKTQVFLGTKKNLKKGEVLDFDNNAYDMLHRLNNEWPSLSIDFVYRDSPFSPKCLSFEKMTKYPYQIYTVQGSSNNTQQNSIYLTKWIKLHKTKYDDDPDMDCDDENDDIGNDDQPQVIVQQIQTTYSVNRIRSLISSPIVSFWNDQGEIHIMDLTKNYQKLKNNIGSKKKEMGREVVLQSDAEGFGLAWNPHKIGQLVTGNVMGRVQVFQNNQGYTSWSKASTYTYHKGSVQDIVFSPNQPTAFATCSSDGTLQIIDMRVGDYKKSQILIKAHDKDVNVCDWSANNPNLIVTGSDDCLVKVWDLRKQQQSKSKSEELLSFNWHTEPITSIKFQPNEQSMIAVASEDNSISFWDMAMQNEEEDPQIPNQLMFIHQGQEQIKQIGFHPVYYEMVVSSALDGINLFKPSYEMPEDQSDKEDLQKKEPIHEKDLDQYIEMMNKRAANN